jgi:hypothetical protein
VRTLSRPSLRIPCAKFTGARPPSLNHEEGDETCWLRVVQPWTGPGIGMHVTPRVGTEVVVGFLDGNPDEPVIQGCIANALTPAPYPYPSGATRLVMRSQSTPEGGEGHNEFSMEDRKGREEVYLRAERDLRELIRRELTQMVGGDLRRMVGGSEHVTVKGDRREHIGGNADSFVDGDVRGEVGGGLSYVINGDVNFMINGKLGVVADELHLRARGSAVIEGAEGTLRGAGGFVRATAGAVLAAPLAHGVHHAPQGPEEDPDQGSLRVRLRHPGLPRRDGPRGEPRMDLPLRREVTPQPAAPRPRVPCPCFREWRALLGKRRALLAEA